MKYGSRFEACYQGLINFCGQLLQHSSKQRTIWEKVIFTHALILGLPTILYWGLQLGGVSLIQLHRVVATAYLVSSLMLMYEATIASSRRFATEERSLLTRTTSLSAKLTYRIKKNLGFRGAELSPWKLPVPRSSFIVAAYLPNEQDIIVETLSHLLFHIRRPEAGLEIILAYNTPIDLPIEQTLKTLAAQHAELILYRVEGSRSKAENVNAALNIVTGEITCILDADHQPQADCFERAWRWLTHGYQVVQGRNVIRNHRQTGLTQLVALEFESIYMISHSAKSLMVDTAIFGGSNGYWQTDVLRQVRFNPLMLTEDIDASMRTLLQGYRIVHDRSISVTELAPTGLGAFWSQRKRWAQGWLEVSLKYQRRVWKSGELTLSQKCFWSYLMYYREIFPVLAAQVGPLIVSQWLLTGRIDFFEHPYLWITAVITLVSGVYQTLVTVKLSLTHYPPAYFLIYALWLPLYTALKNVIAVVAIYDYLQGQAEWVITPRQSRPATAVVTASSTAAISHG